MIFERISYIRKIVIHKEEHYYSVDCHTSVVNLDVIDEVFVVVISKRVDFESVDIVITGNDFGH